MTANLAIPETRDIMNLPPVATLTKDHFSATQTAGGPVQRASNSQVAQFLRAELEGTADFRVGLARATLADLNALPGPFTEAQSAAVLTGAAAGVYSYTAGAWLRIAPLPEETAKAAADRAQLASYGAVDAINDLFVGVGWANVAADTSAPGNYKFVVPSSVSAQFQFCSFVEVDAVGACKFIVADLNLATGIHNIIYEIDFIATVGKKTYPVDLAVPIGACIGFEGAIRFANGLNVEGIEVFQGQGVANGQALATSVLHGFVFNADLQKGVIAYSAERAGASLAKFGQIANRGWSGLALTGLVAPASFNVGFKTPQDATGIVGVKLGQAINGPGKLTIASVNDQNQIVSVFVEREFTVEAGVNYIPLAYDIPAGASVFWASNVFFQGGVNPDGQQYYNNNAALMSGAQLSYSGPHRFEIEFYFASGAEKRLLFLENAEDKDAVSVVRPNDPWVSERGFVGIDERSATTLRGKRFRPDGQGFENSNPGAYVAFRTDSRWLDIQGLFARYAVRDDALIDDAGEVLVDGVSAGLFYGNAQALTSKRFSGRFDLGDTRAMRTVEVVFPYGDSFELESMAIEQNASVAAAAAEPVGVIVATGDSITQGYNASRVTASWVWRLGKIAGKRTLNYGYGGQVASILWAQDAGKIAATYGPNATILRTIGVNNCLTQTPLTDFAATISDEITAMRTEAPLAKIVYNAPFWCPKIEVNTGSGPLVLDQYRAIIEQKVNLAIAAGDSNLAFINGKAAFANDNIGIGDLVHPEDAKQAAAAIYLAARI
jgi:lysophospholipase L1-like esterase